MNIAVFWGIVNIAWFVLNGILGLTSPHLAGDLYYYNAYMWPIDVVIWLLVLGFSVYGEDWDRHAWRKIVASVMWIGAIVFTFVALNLCYVRSHALKATVEEIPVEQSMFSPGFEPRFKPYPVAEKRLPTVQGDTQGASLVNVTYISDPVNGNRWTGIADANTLVTTTKAVVVIEEDGSEYNCPIFTDPITHGWWWHSVVNRVRKQNFTYFIEEKDIYGDCVDGHARIVVPLQYVQWPALVLHPAGIAVIDDQNQITYYVEDEIPADIYGPVYPLSLAKNQRESLTTGRGFFSWIFSEFGYDAPDGEESPNMGNESEFNLVSLSGSAPGMYHVSPLTPKGGSESLVGYSVVSSDTLIPRQYNQVYFLRYPTPRDGLRTMADNLSVNHAEIDWASGQTIFEILPGPGDSFVGYVGKGTAVKYLFNFYGDGTESYVVLNTGSSQEGPLSADNTAQPISPEQLEADCQALWVQLQEASAAKDLPKVNTIAAKILETGCWR